MVRSPLGYAAHALSILMRVVPRAHRFRGALAVARMAAPIVRRSRVREEERARLMETPLDTALHVTLARMHGIPYDPCVRFEGIEILRSALAKRCGVLLVSRHGAMTRAMVRIIHELGGSAIAAFPDSLHLPGTTDRPRVVAPSPTMFLQVRRLFHEGALVAAMIDRWGPRENGDREFLTPHAGSLVIADHLIRLAVRCGAEVLFFAGHAERDGLVMRIARPASIDSAEAITRDFVRFVQNDMSFVRTSSRTV